MRGRLYVSAGRAEQGVVGAWGWWGAALYPSGAEHARSGNGDFEFALY